MNAPLIQELEQLSPAERRLLGEALIQSADSESGAPLLSQQQWDELRERLAWYRAHPDEPGLSFEQVSVLACFHQHRKPLTRADLLGP